MIFFKQWQVTQLETTLAKELSNQTQMLQNLEDERTQVAALKVAHSDLLVKLQDLQAQQTNIESQLQKLQQVGTLVILQVPTARFCLILYGIFTNLFFACTVC
jgi:chromosome segregation ATPase